MNRFLAKCAIAYAFIVAYCLCRKLSRYILIFGTTTTTKSDDTWLWMIVMAGVGLILFAPIVGLFVVTRLPGHCRQCGASMNSSKKRCNKCGVPNPNYIDNDGAILRQRNREGIDIVLLKKKSI